MPKSPCPIIFGIFIFVGIGLTFPQAFADTKTYIGGDNTNWEDAINWDPLGVPNQNDDIEIKAPCQLVFCEALRVNINSDVIIGPSGSITTGNGGTLRAVNPGSLTIQGTYTMINFTDDLVARGGTIVNDCTGIITLSVGQVFTQTFSGNGGTIINHGTITGTRLGGSSNQDNSIFLLSGGLLQNSGTLPSAIKFDLGTFQTISSICPPPDTDGDGIIDEVDTLPSTFSNDFSDLAIGGATSGTIVTRGDQILTITEEANPTGVRIKAESGVASVSFDDVTSFNGVCGFPTPCSFSHTVSAGTNKVLIVGVTPKGGGTVTSVTYGSSALLPIRSDDDGGTAHSSLWYLLDPLPVGPNSVDVVLSANGEVVIGAMSFSGVEQTAITNHAGNTGKSPTPTVDIVTTVNGALIVDVVSTLDGPLTAGLGQQERWDLAQGSTVGGGSTEAATLSGTFTMDWTNSEGVKEWAISAAELLPKPRVATVDACSGASTFNLEAGDEVVVTCTSATIKVISSTVIVTFTGDNEQTAIAIITSGNEITFDPQTFTFSAPPTNPEPVTIVIDGSPTTIDPGSQLDVDVITENISDNLTITSGQIISVKNGATISGNVVVDGGSLVLSEASAVMGNIEGKTGSSISVQGSTVMGNVIVEKPNTSIEITNGIIMGNVKTLDMDILVVTGSNIFGNIFSTTNGDVTITANTVNGNIEISGTTSCTESGNNVNGNNSGCP